MGNVNTAPCSLTKDEIGVHSGKTKCKFQF